MRLLCRHEMRYIGFEMKQALSVQYISVLASVLLSVFAAGASIAGDLTPAQQNKAYDQCMVPCARDIKSSEFGQSFKDKPFVGQAYCSCYCARIALRLTNDQLAQMAKDAVNKGDMFSSADIQAFARRSAEQCFVPLTSP